MPIIPLIRRLRRQIHRDIAVAQDMFVDELYTSLPGAVIHGGTAIWRCYGSSRFSEDIDVYLPAGIKGSSKIKDFLNSLKSKGFIVNKFKLTDNTVYSKFLYGKVVISFEALFKNVKFITKPFERHDGTFINVYTLSPEMLVVEKVAAYTKRRKVRDLYDIYFLLNLCEKAEMIKQNLRAFLRDFSKPSDEKELRALIIVGSVPRTEDMVIEVGRWVK